MTQGLPADTPFWKTPAAIAGRRKMSWWSLVVPILACIAFISLMTPILLAPHSWTIPAQSALTVATGTFSSEKNTRRAPYIFRRSDGGSVVLVCQPDAPGNRCLSDNGVSLETIAGKNSTVGFYASKTKPGLLNYLIPSEANILMTVDVEGKSALTYEQSRQSLQKWSDAEDSGNPVLLFIVTIFPAIFLVILLLALATKWSERKADDNS